MVTGRELTHLMRVHRVTIRDLAARLDITLKRVRAVWAQGLTDRHYVRDWLEAITGTDPGPFPHDTHKETL